MSHWLLLLVTVVLTAVANLLLRYAALNRPAESEPKGIFSALWEILTTVPLLGGIMCLGLAVFAYAIALRQINLSVAYPSMTASVMVLVAAGSAFFFGEPITLIKSIGTVIIICGVILLSQ